MTRRIQRCDAAAVDVDVARCEAIRSASLREFRCKVDRKAGIDDAIAVYRRNGAEIVGHGDLDVAGRLDCRGIARDSTIVFAHVAYPCLTRDSSMHRSINPATIPAPLARYSHGILV